MLQTRSRCVLTKPQKTRLSTNRFFIRILTLLNEMNNYSETNIPGSL